MVVTMMFLEKLIKKINSIIFIFTISILSISLYLVYSLHISYTQKEAVQSLDNALLLTKNMLEEEQQRALSLSVLLSEDKTFLKYYGANQREKVFETINEKIHSLETLQGYRFEVQVHDKNLHTYLRSWDYSIKDIPLSSFREGLVMVKKSHRPMVSIEVGKRLNIKAISPILNGNNFMGSIEVIEGFEHLQEKLLEQGYDVFILLEKKYLSIATTLKQNPVLLNKYVLVNTRTNKKSYDRLQKANLSSLGSYGYFSAVGYAFGYFELKNYHNEKLGYCIVGKKKDVALSSFHQESTPIESNSSGVIIR